MSFILSIIVVTYLANRFNYAPPPSVRVFLSSLAPRERIVVRERVREPTMTELTGAMTQTKRLINVQNDKINVLIYEKNQISIELHFIKTENEILRTLLSNKDK